MLYDCSGYSVERITFPVHKTKEYNVHICKDHPVLNKEIFLARVVW